MKRIYGVFVGTKWGMTSNKKVAMRAAMENNGELRYVNDVPEIQYWDMPTFYTVSQPLEDFRPKNTEQTAAS